ncbi:MAG: tripartite tricarboxylate transporter TctB family protein [Azospirillaceae bacterium]
MMDRSATREGIAGILTALLGGGIVIESWSIPTVFGFNYGPGFFPGLIGIGLLIAGIVQVATAIVRGAPAPVPVAGVGEGQDTRRWRRPMLVLVIMLALTMAMPHLGFHLTAPVALGLLLVIFSLRWRTAIVMAVIMTMVMDAVFRALLLVPLPWGVLTPWTGVLAWRF